MTRRTWTTREVSQLRGLVAARQPADAIALRLRRTRDSVLHKAEHLGLNWGRLLTNAERDVIRTHYATHTAAQIAAMLPGRSVKCVWLAANTMGLSERKFVMTERGKRTIRRLVRAGQCNRCIGKAIGMGKNARMTVRRWRRKLGLPDVPSLGYVVTCQPCMERTRAKLQVLLARHGVRSLAEIRSESFRRRARAAGWPDDLPMPCVRILEALHAIGPMSRRELATASGSRWRGSRFTFNAGGNSYLAMLLRRGLVVSLLRAHRVLGQGKGRSCNVYMLALTTEKKEQSHAAG